MQRWKANRAVESVVVGLLAAAEQLVVAAAAGSDYSTVRSTLPTPLRWHQPVAYLK